MSTTVGSATDLYATLGGRSGGSTTNEAGSADRFLKLLVTQMQNQDPLNPMDNAQITSQMAQINTVSGIEKLNGTVEGLNLQFAQLQAMAGASLVGRDITVEGNRLAVQGGAAAGGFVLDGTASRVVVEVLNGSGRVVDTLDLGTLEAGTHGFNWAAGSQPDGDYRFRVSATQGTVAVSSTPLMRDHVEAVRTSGGTLMLETTSSGLVPWRDVQALN